MTSGSKGGFGSAVDMWEVPLEICQCLPPPSTEKEKLAPAVKIAVWTVHFPVYDCCA